MNEEILTASMLLLYLITEHWSIYCACRVTCTWNTAQFCWLSKPVCLICTIITLLSFHISFTCTLPCELVTCPRGLCAYRITVTRGTTLFKTPKSILTFVTLTGSCMVLALTLTSHWFTVLVGRTKWVTVTRLTTIRVGLWELIESILAGITLLTCKN